MKLIYIRSTMEPKNYSTIRSILKQEQEEKIVPYIFKINDTQTLEAYLRKERITYKIYQEERKIVKESGMKVYFYLTKSRNNLITKKWTNYIDYGTHLVTQPRDFVILLGQNIYGGHVTKPFTVIYISAKKCWTFTIHYFPEHE